MGAKAWYLPCLKAEQNYELKDLWISPSEYGLCLSCKPGGKLEQSRLILWCRAFRGCLLIRAFQQNRPDLQKACLPMTDRPEERQTTHKVELNEFFPFPVVEEREWGAVSLFERAAVLTREREYLPALYQAFQTLDSSGSWQDWLRRNWKADGVEPFCQRAQYVMTEPEERSEIFSGEPRSIAPDEKQQLLELWCRYFACQERPITGEHSAAPTLFPQSV